MRKTLLLLLLPFTMHAQTNNVPKLDAYMRAQSNITHFSGSVLVAQKGKMIYPNGFGEADKEWHVKNIAAGKFRTVHICQRAA